MQTNPLTQPKSQAATERRSAPMPSAPLMAIDAEWLNRESSPRAGFFDDFFGGSQKPPFQRIGSAAVVEISGGLSQRASWFYQGYDEIENTFAAALADTQTSGVVLRIDSPGGVCAGCFEAARKMREMADASGKRVVAYVDEMAYSAAYALATVADEIIVPQSGGVGSVGVIAQSVDYSKALDSAGIRIAVVASGAHKTDSHPAVPLTDAALSRLRDDVAHLAGLFFDSVAERRNMRPEAVKALQAGCFLGQKGVDVGLADSVGTFADALGRLEGLSKRASEKRHMSKQAEAVAEAATEITPEPTLTVSAHNAAIDAERARASAMVETHTKTVTALQASLDAATADKAALASKLAELEAKAAKLDEARIVAKVDSFVGPKLTPAERETYLDLAKASESTFDKLMANRPDLGVLGGRVAPETTGNATRSTDSGASHAEFLRLVEAKTKTGISKSDAMVAVLSERPDLSTEGLPMPTAFPAADRVNGNQLTHVYGLKSADAFVKGQLVQFTSGSSTEVTSVTSADMETTIGIYRGASATAASGDTSEIIFLVPGEIRWLINGGTCTAGTRVAVEGTDGRVTNVGATPASGSVIGIALATNSTDGNYVPVLIAPH